VGTDGGGATPEAANVDVGSAGLALVAVTGGAGPATGSTALTPRSATWSVQARPSQ
jgi:hypothetical protein